MRLHPYQQTALDQLQHWLDALKEARQEYGKIREILGAKKGVPEAVRHFPRAAWDKLKEKQLISGVQRGNQPLIAPDYIPRTAASGEPIPHVCMKIPTGGGKTLLGVASLECLTPGRGLVLWVVPNRAIYEQTYKALRTREHPYRQMLEKMSAGKVKILQKDTRFVKQEVEDNLCIMLLSLPAANRRKSREFLKIFRDSSGYESFFPSDDNAAAHVEMMERHPDLETKEDGRSVKRSLINVIKMLRPTVILDEAHKAYGKNDEDSREFVKSINRLNPRFTLELSATPRIGISNILVNISGAELQSAQMIKLPIEIHNFDNTDWKHVLAEAQGKLEALDKEAVAVKGMLNRYIRPIVLVRVEYTGERQQAPGRIHANYVRDYLIKNLAVPKEQIRVQSSEKKELAGEDLLSEQSVVRWIITKDALKEGWDCPFAYILVMLDKTRAPTAVTQMVGRIMRQPQARTVADSEALNKCYIYCYDQRVSLMVDRVREGLESEGLTEIDGAISGGGTEDGPTSKTIQRRSQFKDLKIFLPQVLHRGKGKKWRKLDYESDILIGVEWHKISPGGVVDLSDEDPAYEAIATVGIGGDYKANGQAVNTGEELDVEFFILRLLDLIPNPWQAARIADSFIKKHQKSGYSDSDIFNNRMHLLRVLRGRVRKAIDVSAEKVFRRKIKAGEIHFRLETNEDLNYDVGSTLEVLVAPNDRTLQGKHGELIQQSLFDTVYDTKFNNLERDFALFLDKSNAIHWWHRIAAGQEYHLQGWQRHLIYPDFLAYRKDDKILVFETKGNHLRGNDDTQYKEKLLKTLEECYTNSLERGEMTVTNPPRAAYRMLFEDKWQEDAQQAINEDTRDPTKGGK